jgi:streptomycin 3"-adenylyltransferase
MKCDSQTTAYLDDIKATLRRIAKGNLLGLYATGSLGFGDYVRGRSDIDLLGVLRQPLAGETKCELKEQLAHDRLSCPAHGLDFAMVVADVAAFPSRRPLRDFGISTGHTWKTETSDGEEEDLLHFAICRQCAIALEGPAPREVFGSVPQDWLLEEMSAGLRWHAGKIFDSYHDPLGQFSTLNACRAMYFMEHKVFCSKTDGGRWVLSREPDNRVVAVALANRNAGAHEAPEKTEIETLLRRVCETIENGRTAQPLRPAGADKPRG